MPTAYSHEKRQEIVDAWDAGHTIKEICAQLGTKSDVTIANYIRAAGRVLPMGRARNRTYQLDQEAFSVLTDEASYWVGFIIADGCVTSTWHLIVGLSERDAEHLHKLNRFLKSNAPVKHRTMRYGTGFQLQVSSKILVTRLNTLGVVPAKSHIAAAPAELQDSVHFWRGIIDGDGHISKDGNVLELVGTAEVCNSFAVFVGKQLGKWPNPITPHSSIWRVRYSTKDTAKILKLLYSYPDHPSLDRKQALADAAF